MQLGSKYFQGMELMKIKTNVIIKHVFCLGSVFSLKDWDLALFWLCFPLRFPLFLALYLCNFDSTEYLVRLEFKINSFNSIIG